MSMASSSTGSERDERVFIAAFGIMDSHQDGEAMAAFMRVRAILRRHGGGFRRMLERSHEAERLNEELGRQNAQLIRENAALRARDSRPTSSSSGGVREPFAVPAIREFRHWDIGLIGIIVVLTNFGLLGFAASLALTAAILISAAFANWFSPIRFFAGVVLGLTALGIVVFNRSASADAPPLAVADTPAAVAPATSGHAVANAASPRQPLADATPPREALVDSPPSPRRISGEPRLRHGSAPGGRCDTHNLQPGSSCSRSVPWRQKSFRDSERPPNARYD